MFQGKRVQISFVCKETCFAGFADLTSKDGQRVLIANRDSYRHYMMCRAQRLVLTGFDQKNAVIDCVVQRSPIAFEPKKVAITCKVNESHIVDIRCEYPEVIVTLADGSTYKFASTFEFLSNVAVDAGDLLALDILYIGQTETTDKNIRLIGHETYGRIADQMMRSEPYSELFIKLLSFDEPVLESQDNEGLPSGWVQGVRDAVGNIPLGQWVTLVEAALIRAVQPPFNNHYKASFPCREHQGYGFFFNTCIDEIEVLIDEQLRRYKWKLPQGTGRVLHVAAPLQDE